MREELTFNELDNQHIELLPARETLSGSVADVWATNASLAFNAATLESFARSEALQSIVVEQR